MYTKMKKAVKLLVAGAILVAGLTFPKAAKASEAVAPAYKNGIRMQNPSFIGIKVAHLDLTTTPTQLVTGQGLLYAVCPNGGTLGKYTVAYDYLKSDSNFPADPLNSLLADGGNPAKYLITPTVPTRVLSSQWGSGGEPYAFSDCFVPPWPIRFEKGLVGVNDNSGHRALFLYRLDDGTNP